MGQFGVLPPIFFSGPPLPAQLLVRMPPLTVPRGRASRYLTATAGVTLGGRRFQLIYLDLAAVFEAAAHGCVDLLFVNPALFSCLELEYEVRGAAEPGAYHSADPGRTRE